MSTYAVIPAQRSDAQYVASDVRRDDLCEWVLASGRHLRPALEDAIELGEGEARTMWLGSAPLCIWGATPIPERPGVGRAWLIGTNLGQQHVRRVQRHFWAGLGELHARFPLLEAWAYEGNTLHHHWMERLGFERTGDRQLMGLGAPFIHFERRASPCA